MKTLVRLWIAGLVSLAARAQEAAGPDAGRNYGGAAPHEDAALLHPPTYDDCLRTGRPVVTRKEIYRDGWIDLNKNGVRDPYEDASRPVDERVEDLLGRMTPDEKTVQMVTLYGYNRVCKEYLPAASWTTALWKDGIGNIDEHLNGFYYFRDDRLPGCAWLWPASRHTWALNEVQRFFIEDTRLGIPADFTDEGIRGIEHVRATCFPTPLAQGATWDRALIRRIGEVTAREAYALGYSNVYAPILDVLRDPRWGRCEETYGESPFLVAELGIQMVLGLQSNGVASTPKHYAIYSAMKGAREGMSRTDPRCGPRETEMVHLWPWERVIRAAHPMGAMSSYNDYDGVPVTGSAYYLTDVLRTRFGFRGYVVSDSDAVEYLAGKHHVAADYKDAVRQAVLAGLNVRTTFTPPEVFVTPLRELVREGGIPMTVLDDRVRDILRVKFALGLFDRPYRPLRPADELVLSPAHLALTRQAARESIVLLKNERGALPWDASRVRTIAVIGPNADNRNYAEGHYGPLDVDVVTVRRALEERFRGRAKVLYARGCDFVDEKWPDTEIMWEPPTAAEQKEIAAAADLVRTADVAVVVVGDNPRGNPRIRGTVGETCSRTGLALTGRQDDLIRAVAAVGKPFVVVNISGRPTALNWANRVAPAIVQSFFPGMAGGPAIVEVLFGDANPGGKLNVSVPKTAGQLELNIPAKPAANAEDIRRDTVSVTGFLWPFGYGLSYTTFEYRGLKIEPRRAGPGQAVTVSFTVANTGRRAGDEIPQLYVRDVVSSVTTYEKNLRGFERIALQPGEVRDVRMTLEPEFLALWNREMRRVVEPGDFEVMVGASSTDIRLRGTFTVGE